MFVGASRTEIDPSLVGGERAQFRTSYGRIKTLLGYPEDPKYYKSAFSWLVKSSDGLHFFEVYEWESSLFYSEKLSSPDEIRGFSEWDFWIRSAAPAEAFLKFAKWIEEIANGEVVINK